MTDSNDSGWQPVHGNGESTRDVGTSSSRSGSSTRSRHPYSAEEPFAGIAGRQDADGHRTVESGAHEQSYTATPLPSPNDIGYSGGQLPSPADSLYSAGSADSPYSYAALESGRGDNLEVISPMSTSTALERAAPLVPATIGSPAELEENSASALSNALLLKQHPVPPTSGWRRRLFLMTGGRVNPGNNAKEQRRIELSKQINQPVHGCFTVAVLSIKGGVGKTTIASTLGSTFANLRGDRVVAVDANPDRGTLVQRGPQDTDAGVRDLLDAMGSLTTYSDIRAFTSQARSRLEVLSSDSDPSISEPLSAAEYSTVLDLLERYYSIVVTDCGTGLLHPAMPAILQGANCLVVVSSGSVDGVRSASATLDWLEAHGFRELVANSIAVVNGVRSRSNPIDMSRLLHHFEQRCRAVRAIPYDKHLAHGGEIMLDLLKPATRSALLELGAAVAQTFSGPPGRTALSRPGRGQDGWT